MRIKPIAGNQVSVREHVPEDRDAYADWQCDPAVAEFLRWLPKSEDESCQCLRDAIKQLGTERRNRFFMAVVRHENQEMIGDVGITLCEGGSGHIGWFIRRKYWDRGYASEAAALMIKIGFEVIRLDQLRASCRRENVRSVRVMQKCGFRLTDASENRLRYSLASADWNRRRGVGV